MCGRCCLFARNKNVTAFPWLLAFYTWVGFLFLGVPLSPIKLTKNQIQPLIDKLADRLASWKSDLLTKAGRKILVRSVLTSMTIYLLMALNLPPWALKAIDKCRRGFLWKGRKDVRGGHCLIAWPKVTRSIKLGGLSISNLQQLSWAFNLRWLWLQKTEPDKIWNFFPVHAPKQVRAFFSVAIVSEVGNGKKYLLLVRLMAAWAKVGSAGPSSFFCNSPESSEKIGV